MFPPTTEKLNVDTTAGGGGGPLTGGGGGGGSLTDCEMGQSISHQLPMPCQVVKPMKFKKKFINNHEV